MKRSIITRRGAIPSIHRWVYANGWHAASAFGLVACLAFPFSPLPSACLFFFAVGLAATRVFVDTLEQLITVINEDYDREERLAPLRPPSLYDQQIRRESVDSIRSSGSDLEDWTYGLGKYAEPDEE